MKGKCITVTMRITGEEHTRLTNAWKKSEGIVNQAQFIRASINAYAGEKIFEQA